MWVGDKNLLEHMLAVLCLGFIPASLGPGCSNTVHAFDVAAGEKASGQGLKLLAELSRLLRNAFLGWSSLCPTFLLKQAMCKFATMFSAPHAPFQSHGWMRTGRG